MKIVHAFILFAAIVAAPANIVSGQDPFAPYCGFYVPVATGTETGTPRIGSVIVLTANADRVTGRVVPTQGAVFPFTTGRISNGELTFETARSRPLSYRFQGKFSQAPPFPKDGKTVILEGTLQTLRSGKKAGERNMKFAMSDGGGE